MLIGGKILQLTSLRLRQGRLTFGQYKQKLRVAGWTADIVAWWRKQITQNTDADGDNTTTTNNTFYLQSALCSETLYKC